MNIFQKQKRKLARARRTNVMMKAQGKTRLLVRRSNTTIYADLIDPVSGKILVGVSGLKMKETGIAMAKAVGTAVAAGAKTNKITEIVFDRNGLRYHGQVKALADAAREGGLKF